MPYKDKLKDREWHKNYMRRKRKPVTPDPNVTPKDLIPLKHLSKEYQAR